MTDYHSEQWLDLTHTMAADVLAGECPWEILADLSDLIRAWGQTLSRDDYTEITPGVFLARDVRVSPTATIAAPCIVGAGSEIRSGAFLRGSTLIGRGCVIGNSTEVKNAILFDGVKAPHFNYIGDMRCDGAPIVLRTTPPISTKRRKLGSVIGDGCEIGCHAVLNPGTILGRGSIVYPLTSVRGVHPEGSRLAGVRGG